MAFPLSTEVDPEPVHATVFRYARAMPEVTAVCENGIETSYLDLYERALQIATAVKTPPGATVALRLPPGLSQVAAMLGVFTRNGHVVSLDTEDRGDRGRTTVTDAQPAVLICDGDNQGFEEPTVDLSRIEQRIEIDPARTPWPSPDDRAYVAFTSGSTGRPKGIAQSHRTLAQFADWFSGQFDIGPRSRVAQWASPGYDASICEIFATLVAGATLYPVPPKLRPNPEKLAEWLAGNEITHLQTVPSFARELIRVIGPNRLTHLLLAGEALPAELANQVRAKLPGVRLVNLYGPTETILATWHPVDGPIDQTVPIGRAIPGREVLVVDAEDQPCPAGVTGEIVIRGPHVTPGYIGHDDTAAFRPLRGRPGHCYRTGDLGRVRRDGGLEFRGRRDHQVKVQGRRLEIGEIEALLTAHESVAECAVLPVRDSTGLVSRMIAVVVPRDGRDSSPQVWRSHLREWFGRSTLAISVKSMPRLPRNAGGKVDRRALQDLVKATP